MQDILKRFKEGNELKVLLVEDSEDDAVFIKYQLKKTKIPFTIRRVEDKETYISALNDFLPDIILSDYNLPSFNGLEALELKNSYSNGTPFIFVTGFLGEEKAVETLISGASNFVLKDNLNRLTNALISALRENEERLKRIGSENALRKSEAKYRQLIEQAADGIFITDGGFHFIDVNSKACQLLGYSKAELVGLGVKDVVPPGISSPTDDIGKLETGESLHYETLRKRKDGSVFAVEISVTKTTDGYFQAIMRDISRRKQTEQALKSALRKLEFHISNSPLAVIESDSTGLIKRWSGQAEKMFGWTEEEATGKHPDELKLVHPEDMAEARKAFRKSIESSSNTFFYVCRSYTKEGTIMHIEWYNSIFTDEKGRHQSLLSLANDVTARKVAEEAKWEGQMQERNRIAREIHEGIGQLLVASKFKVASLDYDKAPGEEKISQVESLLEKTIEEARRISLNMAPRSVEEISIESAIRQLCRQIKKLTGMEVTFNYTGRANEAGNSILSTVYRLVQETLNNTIQHARASQVQIELHQNQKNIELSVKDDGKGFNTSGAEIPASSSLGNMKERINMLGGHFKIESSPGKGTYVAVNIPVKPGI